MLTATPRLRAATGIVKQNGPICLGLVQVCPVSPARVQDSGVGPRVVSRPVPSATWNFGKRSVASPPAEPAVKYEVLPGRPSNRHSRSMVPDCVQMATDVADFDSAGGMGHTQVDPVDGTHHRVEAVQSDNTFRVSEPALIAESVHG